MVFRERVVRNRVSRVKSRFSSFTRAITPGKKLVVLIEQKKALGIVVRNDRPQRRHSGLLATYEQHSCPHDSGF